MNKTELQKQINEIDDTIKELQEKQNRLKEMVNQPENVRWRADYKDKYWLLYSDGVAGNGLELNTVHDNYNYSVGNYFKTAQEAQDYRKNLITKQKLKDIALRLNNGVEMDWKKKKQYKNFIYYDYYGGFLSLGNASDCRSLGMIYCLSKNFLDIAKQEIGEEALIKLIKSGV